MVSLQSWQTLNIFQFLSQIFHDLKQNVYDSTLWVCDSGISQPFSLDLQETGTLLILKIQFHCFEGSLDLQITSETVLVKGKRLKSLEECNHSAPEFLAARFQSLIPLPSSIQPQTALVEMNGTMLTLTLMKSHESQQISKIAVGDLLFPYAKAISAKSASAEFN